MAKEISIKRRRIRRKILGVAIWTLPAAVIILVTVVFFWIFSFPLSDAQEGATVTPRELEIQDILPDREVMQDEPVAVLPTESVDMLPEEMESDSEEESAPSPPAACPQTPLAVQPQARPASLPCQAVYPVSQAPGA